MSEGQNQVLLIAAASESRLGLAAALGGFGVRSIVSSTMAQAEAVLASEAIRLIICADTLPDGSFRDILRFVRGSDLPIPVVVSSFRGDVDQYLEAMELGAFDFIASPIRAPELEAILHAALRPQTTFGMSVST